MDFDPEVVKALKAFTEHLAVESPEIMEVIQQGKDGHLDETEVMQAIAEILGSDPQLASRLEGIGHRQMMPLKQAPLSDPDSVLTYKPTGVPQLNPMYEAALIERVQYDGDIPEMRTGAMPRGAKPAVSVETDARNPVALGKMLQDAADQVGAEVEQRRVEHREAVARVAEGEPLGDVVKDLKHVADAVRDLGAPLAIQGSVSTDVASYKRGSIPAPIRVDQPKGSELAAMPFEEQRKNSWEFLSTTQGRRSAVPTVARLVRDQLRAGGAHVKIGDFDPHEVDQNELVIGIWSVTLGGLGSMQPSFSFIDVACKALTKKLSEGFYLSHKLLLKAEEYSNLSEREVGWRVYLLRIP